MIKITYRLLLEPQDSPVKVQLEPFMEVKDKVEPSPRKTKTSSGDSSNSPGKQRIPRQRQGVKLKMENLMAKEPELTRRRPVRQASRIKYYHNIDSSIVLVRRWFNFFNLHTNLTKI